MAGGGSDFVGGIAIRGNAALPGSGVASGGVAGSVCAAGGGVTGVVGELTF